MKVLIDKNLAILIHVYDILNGGYYAAHHQLRFFDDVAYKLYLNDDKEGLKKLYENLKGSVPSWVLKLVEDSKGIRYFCCDGCHDAQIIDVEHQSDGVAIKIDTTGMLGCLDVKKTYKIILKTETLESCEGLLYDFKSFERMYWLSTDITFEAGKTNFELGVQTFTKESHAETNYKFKVIDIVIE